jgi:mannose-1-phosphate guanylyltransferase/phosphomannomutase
MMNAIFEDPELAFVGGTRGGFIFPEFSFATDALFSIVKILEMMAITGETLGTLDASLEELHRLQRDVACEWDAKGRVMRHAMRDSEGQTRQLIDGIKILFDARNWVLLLPSKDSPQFHIYVEAESHERAYAIADEYEAKVVRWRENG